jgi:superfamily II DNA or RNA helicase
MTKTYKQEIGTAYEYYVLNNIRSEFDKVWHWSNFPEKLMYENNLINDYDIFCKYRADVGADLVALKDNKYYFIQCKNFTDTILMERLAGFYFLLYEYNLTGILYYSGTLSERVKNLSNNKIEFVNLQFNNQTIVRNIPTKMIPRDYQLEAVEKLQDKTAILSLPCGMGKTFTASLLSKKYDNIVILSPLRYLASQTLEQFKDYLGDSYEPILISIDGTRKIDKINSYTKKKNIISATYDSADIVNKIIDDLDNIYLIIDEFHNLSENNLMDPNNNICKLLKMDCNKLFLSATPLKDFMDIKEIYSYSWDNAIKNKYICDFNIYIPDKTDQYTKFTELIKDSCDSAINQLLIKKAYFMLKSMLYNGDKKCIYYLTTIGKATYVNTVLEWLPKLLNIEIDVWQVDCTTKKTIRADIIKKFKETNKIAILLNVHILDEGIDIPDCDSVFITKPSNNIINIIQRMCRANRITETKDTCNIYLWCSAKKTQIIVDYIYNKTDGYTKNKVHVYATTSRTTVKYQDNMYDNIIDLDPVATDENIINDVHSIDKESFNIGSDSVVKHNNMYNDIIDHKPVATDENIINDTHSIDKESFNISSDSVVKHNNINKLNKYQCEVCTQIFKKKHNYDVHLKRKNKCTPPYDPLKCIHCRKLFATKGSAKRHMDGNCSVLKKKEIEEKEITLKLENKNKQLEKTNTKLKELEKTNNKLKKLIKIQNNLSNNNELDIIMVAYGKENIELIDEKEILHAFMSGIDAITNLIEAVHFNPKYPNFHNVYIQNIKEIYATIYDGTKWILKSKKEIINDLYLTKRNYIVDNKYKYSKSMSISEINALNILLNADKDDYIDNKDKKINVRIVQKQKDYIELSIYNNRDMPHNIKKKMHSIDKFNNMIL